MKSLTIAHWSKNVFWQISFVWYDCVRDITDYVHDVITDSVRDVITESVCDVITDSPCDVNNDTSVIAPQC